MIFLYKIKHIKKNIIFVFVQLANKLTLESLDETVHNISIDNNIIPYIESIIVTEWSLYKDEIKMYKEFLIQYLE